MWMGAVLSQCGSCGSRLTPIVWSCLDLTLETSLRGMCTQQSSPQPKVAIDLDQGQDEVF